MKSKEERNNSLSISGINRIKNYLDNPEQNRYKYEHCFILNDEYAEEWIDTFDKILGDRFVVCDHRQIFNAESLSYVIKENSDKFILIFDIKQELYENEMFMSVFKQAVNRNSKFNGFIALCLENDTYQDIRKNILDVFQDKFNDSPSLN